MSLDRTRLLVTAAAALGVACGGAPRSEPATGSQSAQIVDGEARCGVGSEEAASGEALPDLTWVTSASTVRIERTWVGLAGGRVARFDLHRQLDAFVGLASLVVIENTSATAAPSPAHAFHTSALEIRVPLAAMQDFLAALASATPPERASSRVHVTASDDYPSWIVDVESDTHVARFESPATGERPAPWNVAASDRWLPIDPAAPAHACEALASSLQDDALTAALR